MNKHLLSLLLLPILLINFTLPVSADEGDKPVQNIETKSMSIDKKTKETDRFPEKEKQAKLADASKTDVERTVAVEATAYTAWCEGCSGVTYTGIDLRAHPDQKVIAVDPNIIPLGSKVRVPGYGIAVAGDIGGDIEGHRIDIFIAQQEDALDYGRQQIEVEILN
ncbi:3D (Asp-Asp-Asp) domain-containing protein [Halobacillus karajensis]|uniref:3D domain-containing protein n=1 Tax=Halobacillus karajensis TaxID=195088 RepID=UPI0008A761D3|nr:3D (Asp-Asp-Asp) domain-containing protein [Halobacillus karajensis]